MILFGSKSWCHNARSIIVLSREGGFPYDRHWSEVEAVLSREIGALFRSERSIKDAIDAAKREIDSILARNNE